MRFVVVVALLLAGCASGGASRDFKAGIPYPTYEAAMRSSITHSLDDINFGRPFDQADRSKMIQCLTDAHVSGIPTEDQAVMVKAMNEQSFTPEAQALFDKWVPTVKTGSGNRVENNFRDFCPDMIAKYPNMFDRL